MMMWERGECPGGPVQRQQRVRLAEAGAGRQHARQAPQRLRLAAAARRTHHY